MRIKAWSGGADATTSLAKIARGSDLYIDSAGNVGIGTVTPTEELTVANDMLVSGHSRFGNFYTTVDADDAFSVWDKSASIATPAAGSINLLFDPPDGSRQGFGLQVQALGDSANTQTFDALVGGRLKSFLFHSGNITTLTGGIGVAIVKFTKPVTVGTTVAFRGHTTNFSAVISSMQYDHKEVAVSPKGKEVGIKVKDRVREDDKVYLG